MTKRMLIDATHLEETRVVVADDQRLLDYDYESALRKQLRGNIFLAKVTRVEPSLQAAFVNFGGNRHGFLPFSEIHPDYYRIPIADREALLEEQRQQLEEVRRAEEEEDEAEEAEEAFNEEDEDDDEELPTELGGDIKPAIGDEEDSDERANQEASSGADIDQESLEEDPSDERNNRNGRQRNRARHTHRGRNNRGGRGRNRSAPFRSKQVEMVGGDPIEADHPIRPNLGKRYKIQEVVKRGQIMLVQVSKEERGNKGAAVTTYLSLPGRYCVLMPNSPRAGGVSRKIANYKDRKRLREILKEFNIPEGMSVIVRTAGVARTKAEIKRDLDYLMKLWDKIRETTLQSQAPELIYEEGELVKRSIRDIYERDMEEVIVQGEEGYKRAKDIMKMMIPSHAKRVKEYKDQKKSLFHAYNLEKQIGQIGEPHVPLKSGGYLVINPTEALVSVDVNSGKATKERHIEETALKTNLESAEEVARQLRLRDLGGLVVIDFIDMEDRRNNFKVERKLKDALSHDRARLQVGRISSFGLLELSRQRISASVTETQFEKCPQCDGGGYIRTVDSMAIVVLRALESLGLENNAAEVAVTTTPQVAMFILNTKRHMLIDIEQRYNFTILVYANGELSPSNYEVETIKTRKEQQKEQQLEEDFDEASEEESEDNPEAQGSQEEKRGNRNRGNRGGRNRSKNNRGGKGKAKQTEQDDQPREQKADDSTDPQKEAEIPYSPIGPSDVSEDKPKSKPRKSRAGPKKAQDTTVQESENTESRSDETVEAPVSEPADSKREEKPKPKKSNGRKKHTEESALIEPGEPSNDTTPLSDEAENTHAREYEVINEPPKKKKKGWWNKLTE